MPTPPTRHRVMLPLARAGLLALALSAGGAQALEIHFPDFGGTAEQAMFQLNGSAGFSGNRLRLVPDQGGQAGSAFLKQGLFVQASTDFSTRFQFQVSGTQPTSLRSDGFALLIQGAGPGLLGGGGERLGYREASLPPAPYYSYAIEFDTYYNAATDDLSDNEIAVTRSTQQGTQVIAAVDLSTLPVPRPLLDNGQVKNVLVQYGFHGIDRQLSVFLSEGTDTPQLVLQANLPDELFHFGGASTTFGFTAATGGGWANYDILNWQLQVPEPSGGMLTALALAGLALGSRRRRPAAPTAA